MFEKIGKFVVSHKESIIRGAIVIGGGLLGILAAVITVPSADAEEVKIESGESMIDSNDSVTDNDQAI